MSSYFSTRRERLTFIEWVKFMQEFRYYSDYVLSEHPHLKPDTSNHVMY